MKSIFLIAILSVVMYLPVSAQKTTPTLTRNKTVELEIIELEKSWNEAIKNRDAAQMDKFLADSYFLAVGIKGQLLEIVPRKDWLANLKNYKIETYSIDDISVGVYGDTAIALMMWTQKAKVGEAEEDRSGQFVLTDVWVKQKNGWRVAERHSSRPE